MNLNLFLDFPCFHPYNIYIGKTVIVVSSEYDCCKDLIKSIQQMAQI